MKLQFDWVNPDDFTNDAAVEALEKYMQDFLLLDPDVETPEFDREKNLVICNSVEFVLPTAFREMMKDKQTTL